jgi:hypothetical protein
VEIGKFHSIGTTLLTLSKLLVEVGLRLEIIRVVEEVEADMPKQQM